MFGVRPSDRPERKLLVLRGLVAGVDTERQLRLARGVRELGWVAKRVDAEPGPRVSDLLRYRVVGPLHP